MTDFLNFTPHTVNILDLNSEEIASIPSVGEWRLKESVSKKEERCRLGNGKEIAIVGRPKYTGLVNKDNLPVDLFDFEDKNVIVSLVVAQWLLTDDTVAKPSLGIYVPSTGPTHAVRNEKGAIVGTTALERWN